MGREVILNRGLLKVTLFILKILPTTMAVFCLFNTLLSLYGIDVPMLSYMAGISLIPLLLVYLLSYVFKFCRYHRVFLDYIVVNNCLCLYDSYIGIPLELRGMVSSTIAVFCIFLLLTLYLYVKDNKKSIAEDHR